MPRRRVSILIPLVLLVVGCGSTQLSPSGVPATVASGSSPVASTPTASASPSGVAGSSSPGPLTFTPCPPVPSSTACLAGGGGDVHVLVPPGANVTLLLELRNPGSAPSAPVALLLHVLDDTATLPLGQPACTTCSSTTTSKLIGLEWPALAPGEARAVSVAIPVTGAGGTFAADLYARPLADVMADQIANGVTPGQQTWTVDVGIAR